MSSPLNYVFNMATIVFYKSCLPQRLSSGPLNIYLFIFFKGSLERTQQTWSSIFTDSNLMGLMASVGSSLLPQRPTTHPAGPTRPDKNILVPDTPGDPQMVSVQTLTGQSSFELSFERVWSMYPSHTNPSMRVDHHLFSALVKSWEKNWDSFNCFEVMGRRGLEAPKGSMADIFWCASSDLKNVSWFIILMDSDAGKSLLSNALLWSDGFFL